MNDDISRGSAEPAPKSRTEPDRIDVAIGAIWCPTRGVPEVLLTRRGPNVHLPGRWELPGGKVEPGETIPEALRRELMEELALRIDNAEPLVCVEHRYGRRTVRLHVMVAALPCRVQLDGVEHRWVAPEALDAVELPPANTAINEALRSWLWSV